MSKKTQEQIINKFLDDVSFVIEESVALDLAKELRLGALEALLIKKGLITEDEYNSLLDEFLTQSAKDFKHSTILGELSD